MKNQISKIFFVTSFVLVSIIASAQDIHFSQFFETPLYRNPALAGIVKGDYRVQSVYRSQWNSVANAYKTGSLNGEYKMPVGNGDNFLTLGAQVLYDKAGSTDLSTTQVMPAVNFHKSLGSERNTYLSVGFMGGLVQRRFDRSKMTTNSMYEGRGDGENLAANQFSYWDGSVGMSLNSGFGEREENNFVVGVAYHHFNRANNSFYSNSLNSVNPKYVYSAGVKFGVTETSYITLEADHVRQGTSQETIGGFLYGLNLGSDYSGQDYTIKGGAFLRWNDALIPTIKLDYTPFSIGLSYDVNISPLRSSSYGRGGFELSLAFVGFTNRDNSSANAVRCPVY